LAGVAASRFMRPQYVSQATIWVAVTRRDEVDRGPIRTPELLEAAAFTDLLRSYVVLDEAVRRLRLFVTPTEPADSTLFRDFLLGSRFMAGRFEVVVDPTTRRVALLDAAGQQLESLAAGDSIGRSVGFEWAPTAEALLSRSRIRFEVINPRDAALRLGQSLQLRAERGGNFMYAELRGQDPVRITETVNVVTERFVEVAADLKRQKLTQLVGDLREQLRDAESNLHDASIALEDFRVRTITLPAERAMPFAPGLEYTQDPVFRGFFEMRVELEGIRRDREALQRALAQTDSTGFRADAFEAIGAVQRSRELTLALQELTQKQADLRALRYVYTDEHPQVRQRLDEVATLQRGTVPDLAMALLAEMDVRDRELSRNVSAVSQELQQIPPRKMQEAALEREVQIAENLYTMLQQRFEEARLAEATTIPDVSILDRAVTPQRPVRQLAMQVLLGGLASGIGMGIVLAILLSRLDRRVRYPEHVSAQMGLQILGVVPHLRGLKNGRGGRESAPVVEALRGIRLNLQHAYGAAGPIVITVTSPGSGDGKSFLSSNLALAFADAGRRTLLIDADTRRGSLHRVLNAARKPGLTDTLAGRVAADAVIQVTEYPRLSFLGGGTRLPGAPELLGSPQMTQLLASLRPGFDVILVDSPPLGAGVDAYVLGTVTGNLLLVMRTGQTDREEAEAKLDVLDRLPVRVLGAILNDAKDQRLYGYGYYSYYMPGYEYQEEVEAATALPEGTD
jgi:tyrosine-protein kinase Etk/Wzc